MTPFLPKGQRRSALKAGNFPVFDDIDFAILRSYLTSNKAALGASLTPDGLAEFQRATDLAEDSITAWKNAEPRIWGISSAEYTNCWIGNPTSNQLRRA